MKNQIFSTLAVTGIAFTSLVMPLEAQAQRVVGVNPGVETKNVSPDTSISGLFETEQGEEIEVDSVRILVNGNDVTEQSTITPNFFSYRPDKPLPPGQNQIKVEYQNTMGEQRSVNWTFSVEQPTQALNIESVTHNAKDTLGSGATFLATIKGTPNANASVLLISEETDKVQSLPAEEVSSGVYVATLNVSPEEAFKNVVIVGRLQQDDQMIHAAASETARFDASVASTNEPVVEEQASETVETEEQPTEEQASETAETEEESRDVAATYPLRPAFLSHQNGDKVDAANGFVLKGQTKPSAEINIEVNAKRQVLGGLVDIGSTDLINKQVVADENGQFEVTVPAPPKISSGLRYTIQATASKGEENSQATEITLIQE
ncbi:MAG: hypothetical protein BRC33_10905 [Cyanobacteria bacterium SW_9_44_58]|nr:MAG: hypothetical protein BRC33_10905 [Cyanobacteria bacterium SW_9_44_58]